MSANGNSNGTVSKGALHELSAAGQLSALASGQCSSVELTEHYLARIERLDADLNTFITVDRDGALAAASEADAARARGEAGALNGLPIAHKDIFCTEGLRTTAGSRMLENFTAPYSATVVSRLAAAGVVNLGKANMDEFAMGSSNENSYFGAVSNPWDASRVPGGSSGGSAAVVAAHLAAASTGTDTGGSIRQPAAFCGLTGIKPTYGRVSRYGMIAFASSLDQAGPMARNAEDCALLLNVMCGADERDSTSSNLAVPDFTATLNQPLSGLRVGVPEEYFGGGLDAATGAAVQAALEQLQQQGATLKTVHLPNQASCIPAYYVVAPAEASSNLSRFDGVRFGHRCDNPQNIDDLYLRSRSEGFGPEVQRRILVGTYALSAGYYDAYYRKAQRVRTLISEDFDRAFAEVDVIAGPTTPTPAFARGEKADDPVAMYLNDLYTVSANLSGLPALSVGCGFVDGLPVGLQLMAPDFQEGRLLNVAHQYQQATDWHRQMPASMA